MKFRVTTQLNDGLAEAASIEVAVTQPEQLLSLIEEEAWEGDEGIALPIGGTVLIERVA